MCWWRFGIDPPVRAEESCWWKFDESVVPSGWICCWAWSISYFCLSASLSKEYWKIIRKIKISKWLGPHTDFHYYILGILKVEISSSLSFESNTSIKQKNNFSEFVKNIKSNQKYNFFWEFATYLCYLHISISQKVNTRQTTPKKIQTGFEQ